MEKLIQSSIFPSEADCSVLCDWLQQVSFLFKMAWPEDDVTEPVPVEVLDQTLSLSSALIGFCQDRLKREKSSQLKFDWTKLVD